MRAAIVAVCSALIGTGVWLGCRPPSADVLPRRLPELGPACGTRCGTARWAVKTLSDVDRARVNLTPVDATVEELGRLPRPARVPAERRVGPVELTTYRVTGCLGILDREPENDGDIHVIIGGLENPRLSMVTEIPNPSCGGVCQSGLGPYYARARATLDSIIAAGVVSPACNNDVPLVTIIGVGFFDRNHGQRGAAPNFIELHPVLALTLSR